MSDRRAELERKREKLAQIRALQKTKGKTQGLPPAKEDITADASSGPSRADAANEILASLGIGPVGDAIARDSSDSVPRNSSYSDLPSQEISESAKPVRRGTSNFTVISLQQTSIPPKESVTYNKQTQTNGSGSLTDSPFGAQGKKAQPLDYYVLTYDDVNVEEDGEGSSLPYGTPPPSYQSHHKSHRDREAHSERGELPVVEMVKPAQTPQETAALEDKEKEKHKRKRRELSEEEKAQIILKDDFKKFFDKATRITERALCLNETPDIFIDYSGVKEEVEGDDKRGANLSFNRCFFDERWTKNRTVTSLSWSTQFPELLLASYNNNEDAPNEPDGVVLVWNTRFKKATPEYVFQCQSPVMSACFAKFHPNLIVGGTYSGQIVLWDNRSNKKTPVQRSPLSAAAHTHPIYCIDVVGTQNAHNLITISTDGKLCSWSLDMLSQPQDAMELSQQKQSRPVAVTCVSFPESDFNNFIIGSEEGAVYGACRHGSKAGISDAFEGHQGPITGIDCHPVQSQIDFSHLFLTSSIDWTVKLWSAKENKYLYSFEDNCDYLYDVRWSPVHPALFATADGMGRLDLWNLNNDTELPTASVTVEGNPALNRIIWTPSGHQVAAGDDAGKIWIYDIGEQLASPKGDESSKFMHTLQELRNNNLEPDAALDTASDTAYSSLSSASFTSPLR